MGTDATEHAHMTIGASEHVQRSIGEAEHIYMIIGATEHVPESTMRYHTSFDLLVQKKAKRIVP